MRISSLNLFYFRNYEEERLTLHPRVNFFWGANGQGKTNLIEAIYFLSRGASFRVHKAKALEVLPFKTELLEQRQASLKIEIEEGNQKNEVFWKYQEGRSQLLWNQKRASSAQISQKLPLILFSPESLSAIKDGPGARREVLDEFLLSLTSENADLYKDFKKALKSRNQVFKDLHKGNLNLTQARDIILSLNPTYLKLSSQLTSLRVELIKELSGFMDQVFRIFFERGEGSVIIDYFISSDKATNWTYKAIYDKISHKIKERENNEFEAGTSLVSPQKHDVVFSINKEDSRYYSSQAQQRVLILAFKIAQALYYEKKYKKLPILLLDDIFSELDEERKKKLTQFLKSYKGQLFLTGTNIEKVKSQFNEKSGKVFEIKKGKILTCQT